MARRVLVYAAYAAVLFSCYENKTAVLWSCHPEFALYANYYNAERRGYKIEVRYIEEPIAELDAAKNKNSIEKPDIIIATYMYNNAAFKKFANLNSLFKHDINAQAFYPALLKAGSDGTAQRVIPISFNVPVAVFTNDNKSLDIDNSYIELDTLREEGISFNVKDNSGAAQRIGFSPLWEKDNSFIYLVTRLYNVDFMDNGAGIAWNKEALIESVTALKTWINSSTGNIQIEDDFIYKYFFNSPVRLISNKRVRFLSMNSSEYWMLDSVDQTGLEIKWICRDEKIPALENIPSFAIYKNSKAKKAAEDFAKWFFNEAAQDMLLEKTSQNQLKSSIFGIAGGFSAMRSVTDFFFPKYYEGLLGRTPPHLLLSAPPPLPETWNDIKKEVVLPFIVDYIRDNSKDINDINNLLEEHFAEWSGLRQGVFNE